MEQEICKGKEAYWIVKNVKATKDYTLIITFIDGKKKTYNMTPLLEKKMYKPLKNLNFFMKAKVSGDTVSWSDDIDIAPEYLYENAKEI